MDPSALSWAKSFNSGYRLTLRALAASVRHHPTSTKNLRRLYRPVFRDAAINHNKYAATQSNEARLYLQEWNLRLDRTLELLLSSATAGGPVKRLVRNLSTLTDVYQTRVDADATVRHKRAGEWNGQDVGKVNHKKLAAPTAQEKVQLSAWSALGELVLAAENDTRTMLGRQEQRQLDYTRMSVTRRVLQKNQKGIYKLVGKTITRPSRLRI